MLKPLRKFNNGDGALLCNICRTIMLTGNEALKSDEILCEECNKNYNMKQLLWLDDIRNPFVGDWLMQYAPQFTCDEGEVTWVKSYDEFTKWIIENGLPDMIAFDHDLGTDKSGLDCTKWLVDYCMDNDMDLPQWTIQSANPVGADNINGMLNGYKKFRNK